MYGGREKPIVKRARERHQSFETSLSQRPMSSRGIPEHARPLMWRPGSPGKHQQLHTAAVVDIGERLEGFLGSQLPPEIDRRPQPPADKTHKCSFICIL